MSNATAVIPCVEPPIGPPVVDNLSLPFSILLSIVWLTNTLVLAVHKVRFREHGYRHLVGIK